MAEDKKNNVSRTPLSIKFKLLKREMERIQRG